MNFSINSNPINAFTINGEPISSDIIASGSGTLISFEQTVLIQASGTLIFFDQSVELLTTAGGVFISFDQSVITQGQGTLISFYQSVASAASASFLQRNGWYPIIIIDDNRVPDNMIRNFTIDKSEGDAANLQLEMLMPTGNIDINSYIAKRITVDIVMANGSGYRAFTGFINIPTIDLINRYLTLSCLDLRREIINSQLANSIQNIGYYSKELFGDGTGDIADQLDQRLTTVPLAVDITNYGALSIYSLIPKTTPDFTLNNSDVYRGDGRDPTYTKAIRSKLTNKVNLTFTYQYQRAYQRVRNFSWSAQYGSTCNFLLEGFDVAKREMIEAAIKAAGWPVVNRVNYTPVLANGFYKCFGANIGFTTIQTTGTNSPLKDTLGNNITDSAGQQIYQYVATKQVDMRNQLCFGASWNAATRFTQNLSETYTMSVSAPQSINQYGVIETSESGSVTSEFDSTAWENFTTYTGYPSIGPRVPNNSVNFYVNLDTNIGGYYNAMYTMLNRARTTILKAHREDKVDFIRNIWPQVDIYHTVALNTSTIQCRGKVYTITHTCDVTTGEATTKVQLAMSTATGSASDSPLSIPARPVYNPPQEDVLGVRLQSHYGLPPQDNWNGFIGNKFVTETVVRQGPNGFYYNATNRFRTSYDVSFTVDTPPIEDAVRANVNIGSTASYSVAIPADPLTLTVI